MPASQLLIAVHGWLLSKQVWSPLAACWKERHPEIELWCPDLPGFGDAERPSGLLPNLSAYGRWLADDAIHRAQGRPFVLLGHSLGGSVVLHAEAHLRQQKQPGLLGVVLLAAGGGIYQPRPFRRLRGFGKLILELRPDALAQLPAPLGALGPFKAERRAARGLLVNSTSRGAVRDLPGLVSDLAVDSLWISGDNDQVMEPGYVRHLAAYSPGHDYRQISGCGHLPMREKPEMLSDILSSWIEAQSLARPRS